MIQNWSKNGLKRSISGPKLVGTPRLYATSIRQKKGCA